MRYVKITLFTIAITILLMGCKSNEVSIESVMENPEQWMVVDFFAVINDKHIELSKAIKVMNRTSEESFLIAKDPEQNVLNLLEANYQEDSLEYISLDKAEKVYGIIREYMESEFDEQAYNLKIIPTIKAHTVYSGEVYLINNQHQVEQVDVENFSAYVARVSVGESILFFYFDDEIF